MRKSWTFRTSRHFWLRDDLSLGAKGVAHVLLSFADKDGMAWPTTPQIAEAARISTDTADKYLRELRDQGVISWTIWMDEHGHKRRKFNLDPKGVKLPVGQGGKITPLTCTSKQAERLFIRPTGWDGLGGKEHDGRRTMQHHQE